jgi:hypothetical protein
MSHSSDSNGASICFLRFVTSNFAFSHKSGQIEDSSISYKCSQTVLGTVMRRMANPLRGEKGEKGEILYAILLIRSA